MPSRDAADRERVVEQEYVTALYARLDALREQAAARLAAARGSGTDRETTAFWQAELGRLESVEDGLVRAHRGASSARQPSVRVEGNDPRRNSPDNTASTCADSITCCCAGDVGRLVA